MFRNCTQKVKKQRMHKFKQPNLKNLLALNLNNDKNIYFYLHSINPTAG